MNKGMLTARYNRKNVVFVVKKGADKVPSKNFTVDVDVDGGEIMPDIVKPYKKVSMRNAHHLGYHNSGCITDMVRCVTLNDGTVIEPLKEGVRYCDDKLLSEQYKIMSNIACAVFIQRHGYLTLGGVIELLKTRNIKYNYAILSDVCKKIHQSHGKGLKHNSGADSIDMSAWSDVDVTKRSKSYNTRLENIIKCCYR